MTLQTNDLHPESTTQNSDMSSKKYRTRFIIGLTILLFVAGSFLIWHIFITPNIAKQDNGLISENEQFIDWKTYHDKKYRFEFRYPQNLYADNYGSENYIALYHSLPGKNTEVPSLNFTVAENPDNLPIKSFFDGKREANLYEQTMPEDIVPISIGGVEGVKFDPYISFAGGEVIVLPIKSAYLIIFDDGGSFKRMGILETILSTLKINSFNYYENPKYSISFSYPTEYIVKESETGLFITTSKNVESGMPPLIKITMNKIASTTETQKISYDENIDGVKFSKTTEIIDYDSNMAVDTYSFHPAPDKVVHFTLSSTAAPEIKGILNSVQSLNYRSNTKNTF